MTVKQNVVDALDRVMAALDTYIADYEFGEEGYTPTTFEKLLIADAIHGLTSDETFMAAFYEWRRLVREPR